MDFLVSKPFVISLGVLSIQLLIGIIILLYLYIRMKTEASVMREQLKLIPQLQGESNQKSSQLAQTQEDLHKKELELSAANTTLISRQEEITKLEQTGQDHLLQISRLQSELQQIKIEFNAAKATLDSERAAFAKSIRQTEETFRNLSNQALKHANEEFLKLAQERFSNQQEMSAVELEKRKTAIENLLKPLAEQMNRLDTHNRELEKNRNLAYSAINERIMGLIQSETDLKKQSDRLVSALRDYRVRGHWGEVQLKNLVEASGMTEHVDFEQQFSQTTETGGRLRPDMIVKLPNGKRIIIDAKTPMDSYLKSIDCAGDSPQEKVQMEAYLKEHLRQVKGKIEQLSKYQENFDNSLDFCVMFLPCEGMLSAAFKEDANLLVYAYSQKVVIATPCTLVGLLGTVYQCWKDQNLANEIKKVANDAADVYKAVVSLIDYFENFGNSLKKCVENYNKLVGSAERTLIPKAKHLEEDRKKLPNIPENKKLNDEDIPREIGIVRDFNKLAQEPHSILL